MTTTIKPKKAPKAPSIEQLARQKARGQTNGIPHPAVTSTSTPAGIAANDRDAWAARSHVGSTPPKLLDDATLRQRLDAIARATPSMPSHAALRAADLQAALVWKAEEWEEAEDLVDRYGYLVKPTAPIVSPERPAETKPAKRETKGSQRETTTGDPEVSPAVREAVVAMGVPLNIGIDLLHEHPENRDSKDSDPDIKELAASIADDTQLQPIMVRQAPPHWKLPAGHFQIVFGERRWRACRVAGLQSVRGVIRTDLDDATTRRLIVIENAKRKDLNAIQKAQLIETLCSPNKDGSQGLTREAAAKHVGLESGSAASNLVRLLKLPKVWQERVAAGELDESWARLIVPYIALPPVMEQLETEWKERKEAIYPEDSAFTSRNALEDELPAMVDRCCRRIDQERYTSRGYVKPKIDAADDKVRRELGIVEMELPDRNGKRKTVAVATNVKAFDTLVTSQAASKSKATAEKAGRDSPAAKRELTPAERKQKAAERTETRNDRIAAWRDKLLRDELVGVLMHGQDTGFRLVLAYAAGPVMGCSFEDVLTAVTKTKAQHQGYRSYYWAAVANNEDVDDQIALTRSIAIHLLQREASDWRRPTMPHALVERYAEDLEVDVAVAWLSLQETQGNKLVREALLEEFFLIHQTEELRALAKELGVGVPQTANRSTMVKLLLAAPRNSTRRLPLPKSIKPVATAVEAKPAKKGGRR
jgi:ParB/RepB/Spo0J family partition protein